MQNYTKSGNICPQLDDLNDATKVVGDEDCLVLDVYQPAANDDQKLPVLVFVHGGSFAVGSSTSDFHGVDLLVENVSLKINKKFKTKDQNLPGDHRSQHSIPIGSSGISTIFPVQHQWKLWPQRSTHRPAVGSAVHPPLRR